jgi:hypothetical protein
MDTDTNLDPTDQAVIHYRAVDLDRIVVVLSCMDTHLEAENIHRAEEDKGMDKENSQALSLMEALELVMKMKPSLMWMI